MLGFGEDSLSWLAAHGLDTVAGKEALTDVGLVLVGHAGELDADQWQALNEAVDRGATAVVLSPWELIEPGQTSVALPLGVPVSCTSFHDWLYHKECFARTRGLCRWLAGTGSHALALLR